MQLIKDDHLKRYFIGWKVLDPIWQTDRERAMISFRAFLKCNPSTTVKKEFEKVNKIRRYTNKLIIIRTW